MLVDIASSVTHRVRLPRRRRPASYSAQFVTLNFIFDMWWRRFSLCLFGMERYALSGACTLPDWPGIHATTPIEINNLPVQLAVTQCHIHADFLDFFGTYVSVDLRKRCPKNSPTSSSDSPAANSRCAKELRSVRPPWRGTVIPARSNVALVWR